MLVSANDKVFAGELLLRLDDEEAVARVAAAEARVALAKRARNDEAMPAGSAERRKAEDAAADAERAVADARAALDRVAAERRAGSATQADLDAARTALPRAQDRAARAAGRSAPSCGPPPIRPCRPAWRASSTWRAPS